MSCSSTRVINVQNDTPELVKYKRTYYMRHANSKYAEKVYHVEESQSVVVTLDWLEERVYARCFMTHDIDKRNIQINKNYFATLDESSKEHLVQQALAFCVYQKYKYGFPFIDMTSY
jgi:hypothetical protein